MLDCVREYEQISAYRLLNSECNLLLNFSTLNPTVGTTSMHRSSSCLNWLMTVDLPLLFNPTINTFTSLLFRLIIMVASRSNKPIIGSRSTLCLHGYVVEISISNPVQLRVAFVKSGSDASLLIRCSLISCHYFLFVFCCFFLFFRYWNGMMETRQKCI